MQGVIACEIHTFTWAMWYFPGASGTMSIMGTPSTTGVCLFQVNSGLKAVVGGTAIFATGTMVMGAWNGWPALVWTIFVPRRTLI